MHLFSRSILLNAVTPETVGVASDLRAYASDVLGTEIGLWSVAFGAPYGTMVYAAPADGLAGVADMNTKLAEDATYHEKAAALRAHAAGPAESMLMAPLHGEIRADGAPPLGAVATVTTAVANGPYDQVAGFGIELAQLAESITGMPIVFGSGAAGTFGEFAWVGVAADAAAADEANTKLLADADYVAKISAGVELFVAGGAHRTISTRVA